MTERRLWPVPRPHALAALSLACLAVVAIAGVALAGAPRLHVSERAAVSTASCPRTVRGLGQIAFIAGDRLERLDLATCHVSELAGSVAGDVRFSADGQWISFARYVRGNEVGPAVVAATGGGVRLPLGAQAVAWSWAPTGDVLYGITRAGQLVSGTPGSAPRVIASNLQTPLPWDQTAAVSPTGGRVAIDRSECGTAPTAELDTVAVATGARTVAVLTKGGQASFAGWSPDGKWLLYWAASECSSSLAADGWPLEAVSASGGRPQRAVRHMLLYPDDLTWCGSRLIAAAGSSRETQIGSSLVSTGPPTWQQRTLDRASTLSWVSPACSPSGKLLAVAAGPNNAPASFGEEHRSILLLTPGGTVLERLTTPPAADLSDEAPRFSRDGSWILFVRSRELDNVSAPGSQATLELVRARIHGRAAAIPIVSFRSQDTSYYDHFSWPTEIDWSEPAATAASLPGRTPPPA